jgi:WD40 repeat protein
LRGDFPGKYPQISPDNKWIIYHGLINYMKNNWIIIEGSHVNKKIDMKGWNGESKLFQLSTGKLIKTIHWRCCDCPYSGDPAPPDVIFSTDGKHFCISLNCKRLGIFESETGKLLFKIKNVWDEYPGLDSRYTKFSYDGNWIATFYSTGRIQIWNIKTGKLTYDIEGYLSDFHPTLPLILIENKGICSLVSLSSGKPLLSFDYIGSNDWVVLHPSGLFDTSPGAMEHLYFVQDEEIIELDSLKDKYYEPGLWEKIMSGEPLRILNN